jgi:NADH:ubiquinone oxidoreductase subunit K
MSTLILSEEILAGLNLFVILRPEYNNLILLLHKELVVFFYNAQFSYDTFSVVGMLLYTVFPLAIFLISLLFITMLFSIAILGNKIIPYYKANLAIFYTHTFGKAAKPKNIFFNIWPLWDNIESIFLDNFFLFFFGCIIFFGCIGFLFYFINSNFIKFIKFIIIVEFFFIGIILMLIYFSSFHMDINGVLFVLFLLGLFTCETIIGLLLFILYKTK